MKQNMTIVKTQKFKGIKSEVGWIPQQMFNNFTNYENV